MKKKLLLGALAALMVMPLSVSVASASAITIGSPVTQLTSKGWGKYYKYNFNYNGNQNVFYGEYDVRNLDDYEFVVHNVKNSSGAPVLKKVKDIADDFTSKTGRKVIMATNGDYFSYDTGVQVSSLVMEGQVYGTWYSGGSTPKHDYGFDNKGNFAIGQMKATKEVVRMEVNDVAYEIDIDKTNAVPADGEVALYTNAYNTSIPNTNKFKFAADGDDLAARPLTASCRVMGAVDGEKLTLSGGQFALVTKGESKAASFLSQYATYGAACEIIKAPSGDFAGMQYVVGGWEILVKDGQIGNTSSYHEGDGAVYAPRTFIGNKADGSMFLCVTDGRNKGVPAAVGFKVTELANLAVALGAENALELDGGGSSTFWYDLGSGLQLLNSPSDGSQRAVSNAVMLVEKGPDAVEYVSVEEWNNGGSSSGGGSSSDSNSSSGGSTSTGGGEGSSGNSGGQGGAESSGCSGSVGFGSVGIFVAAAFVCAKALKNKENKDGGNKDEESI